jgi:uncharacterized membrane protein YgcG
MIEMKCPSCAAVLEAPGPRCPQCKLSLQKLDIKFGLVPAHSRYLTDRTGLLPLEEMKELRAELRLFEKKFPQAVFSILLTELPPGTSVAEYAFWLANRAKFGALQTRQSANYNILLVIDVAAKSAALTVGYGLERFVPEEELQHTLDDLARAVREDGLAAGLRACIESLTRRLRELSAKARTVELQPA